MGLDDGAIELRYSYKFGASFSASTELQTQIAGWYANGTEVVFACGGSMFQSVKAAAEEYTGAKIIGVDVDQSNESDRVITSAVKGLSASVQKVLGQYYDGKWDAELAGKSQNLGAADNATGLPTDTWSMTKFTVDDYKTVLASIKDGTVTPKSDVPADANNKDWLDALGLKKVSISFES